MKTVFAAESSGKAFFSISLKRKMDNQIVILPFLQWQKNIGLPERAQFFNPGLSEKNLGMPDMYYCPYEIPIRLEKADAILADMLEASVIYPDLLINGFNPFMQDKKTAYRREMEELSLFVKGKPSKDKKVDKWLHSAQMILLWAWAAESIQKEIEDLEEEVKLKESLLQQIFDDFSEKNNDCTKAKGLAGSEGNWKKITEMALFFLPPEIFIFATGHMGRELMENKNLQAVGQRISDDGVCFQILAGPAWSALGFKNEDRYKFLKEYDLWDNFVHKRNWIVSRDN